MLSFSTWREYRLRDRLTECFCVRQGAGTTVLCKPAFRFSQFYLSKAVLYTQSVVRVLYLARVLYSARSPHFLPSPCFIPSPQSIFYTDRFAKQKFKLQITSNANWWSVAKLPFVLEKKYQFHQVLFINFRSAFSITWKHYHVLAIIYRTYTDA